MSFLGNGEVVASNVLDGYDAPLPPLKRPVAKSKPSHLSEPFVVGPFPADWFRQACETKSSDACKVALALWQAKGMKRNSNIVRLNSYVRKCFGIERNVASRGLKKLSVAGLIEILEQKPGRHPLVKIISSGGTSSEVAGK
jgi:hypothetical protein